MAKKIYCKDKCVGGGVVAFGEIMASVRLLEAIRALPMAAVNDLRIVTADGAVETNCLLMASASPMMRSALEDPFNAAAEGAVVALCPDMSKEDVEAFVEALLARADNLVSHDGPWLRALDCFSVHCPVCTDVESDFVERTEDPLGDLGEQFSVEPAAVPLASGVGIKTGAPRTKRSAVAPPPTTMSNSDGKEVDTKKLVPKKVSTYPCTLCDSVLATSYSLKVHFSTIHSKERNYKCEVCGRKFAQQSHLTGHLKSHNGYKNWLCCTCGKALANAQSLKVRKYKLPPCNAPHPVLCRAEAPRESRARRPQGRGRTGKLQAKAAQVSPREDKARIRRLLVRPLLQAAPQPVRPRKAHPVSHR